MKINVKCLNCQSVFQVPDLFAGQTVKCPSCSKSVLVPQADSGAEDKVGQEDGGGIGQGAVMQDFDFNALAPNAGNAGSQARGGKRRVQRTAGVKAGASKNPGSEAIGDDLSGRMERLYGIYAGEELQNNRKGKFTMGLGISLGVVLIAVVGGGYMAMQMFKGAATVTEGPELTMPVDFDKDQMAENLQKIDKSKLWTAAGDAMVSSAVLEYGRIEAEWKNDGQTYAFKMRVKPEGNVSGRLKSLAKAVLYRSFEENGDYYQANKVSLDSFNRTTGELVFQLMDAKVIDKEDKHNHVYYRIVLEDHEGKRIIDTPIQKFPVVKKPSVRGGNMVWKPVNPDEKNAAKISCDFYLDVDGWRDVVVYQIASNEAILQRLPEFAVEESQNVKLSFVMPTYATIDNTGAVEWQCHSVQHQVKRIARAGKGYVVGLIPVYGQENTFATMLPDEDEFEDFMIQDKKNSVGMTVGKTLVFKSKTTGRMESVEIPYVAGPTQVMMMPFDDQVKLSWDAKELSSTLNAYTERVAIAIYRESKSGGRKLVDVIDPMISEYSDKSVKAGDSYRYELVLTSALMPGREPVLRTNSWIADAGVVPVLVKYQPRVSTEWISPEEGLDQLNVVLGKSQLSVSGTGMDALAARKILADVVSKYEGVSLMDREIVKAYYAKCHESATAGGNLEEMVWTSKPAHMELVFVDENRVDGNYLQLWAKEFCSGKSRKLYEAKIGEVSEAELIVAIENCVKPFASKNDIVAEKVAPRQVIVEPLNAVEQMCLCFNGDDVSESLRKGLVRELDGVNVLMLGEAGEAGEVESLGTLALGGRVWTNTEGGRGVSLRAVDLATSEVVGMKFVEKLNAAAIREVASWVKELKVGDKEKRYMTSALRVRENKYKPLSKVWNALKPMYGIGKANAGEVLHEGVKTFAFGAVKPAGLMGMGIAGAREGGDPLATARPYVAVETPLMFDMWVKTYAKFAEQDGKAFLDGVNAIYDAAREEGGPILPRIVVRGKEVYAGETAIEMHQGPGVTMHNLVVGAYEKVPHTEVPMATYFEELREDFYQNPYVSYHVWKQVPIEVSESFLKGVMHGLEKGRFKGLEKRHNRPVELARYAAAKILADSGSREAQKMVDGVQEFSRRACRKLKTLRRELSAENAKYPPLALMVMLFEDDDSAKKNLKSSYVRGKFFVDVDNVDLLRMLLDRMGGEVLKWNSRKNIDWSKFVWRNLAEMKYIAQNHAREMTKEEYVQICKWAGIEAKKGISHKKKYQVKPNNASGATGGVAKPAQENKPVFGL